jgi:hypothetical protein
MCTVTKESLVSTCVWECANTSETHASRFGVPNRRRYRLTVGHRPRSAVVRHRCRKGIARERRVDRYYDPSTDQFISVDPDVAETGQPYAFTGDDPLNETDPLGLSGDAKADEAYDVRHHVNCGHRGERRCPSAFNAIVHGADALRHSVAAHPVAALGLVLGAVALVIPGAEPVGLELEEDSGAALASSTDLSGGTLLQTAKTVTGIGAVVADADGCVSDPTFGSCGGAAFGAGALVTLNPVDELLGYGIAYAGDAWDSR